MYRPTQEDVLNFIKSLKRPCKGGCWLWKKGDSLTYPTFKLSNGKYIQASHFSLLLYKHLHIMPKQMACHKCDNPRCVNPNHLFIGTASINFKDSLKKGRASWNVNNMNKLFDK